MLHAVSRSFRFWTNESFCAVYLALIRSKLEYANATSAWNPHHVQDIELLERVQCRATKCFKPCRHLPYSDRLDVLHLLPLRVRRARHDLILVYKLLHGMLDYD
jgi:hypothetical protein